MEKSEYISRAFRNNDYVSQEDKEETYEIAKRELFLTIYSSDTSKINENTKIPYVYEYKVLEAMKEIIEIGNMRYFTSYSENGWSWKRPSDGLSTYKNILSKAVGF